MYYIILNQTYYENDNSTLSNYLKNFKCKQKNKNIYKIYAELYIT